MDLVAAREFKSAFLTSFDAETRSVWRRVQRRGDGVAAAYELGAGGLPGLHAWDGVALGLTHRTGNEIGFALRATSEPILETRTVSRFLDLHKGSVDLKVTGEIRALTCGVNIAKVRPARTGFSVGHHRVTAGTIGAFVSRTGKRQLILSNNHVLADCNRGRAGDAVLQPGSHDGGGPGDKIGRLVEFVPLDPQAPNLVDAAIAELDEGVDRELMTSVSSVLGSDEVDDGLEVAKDGRTTGHTEGVVTAVEVSGLPVNYGTAGVFSFDNQIEIGGLHKSAFSAPGDSGSLVVTRSEPCTAVGLLFAGSIEPGRTHRTYASPIDVVLSSLDIELTWAHAQ